MALAPDELRNVLARAEEIQSASSISTIELEAVIQAAEEVGIARSAIERALRERLHLPLRVPAVGELTFAKSADGKFYVAEIVSMSDDVFRVRFLRGGEHHVAVDELRPCSFLPGEQVVCYWPWWGPWTCTVLSYDEKRAQVKVTDGWGDAKTFPISEVWIAPRKKAVTTRSRVYAALIGVGIAAGAAIGAIVTGLLLP
jgi:hypothetical protein